MALLHAVEVGRARAGPPRSSPAGRPARARASAPARARAGAARRTRARRTASVTRGGRLAVSRSVSGSGAKPSSAAKRARRSGAQRIALVGLRRRAPSGSAASRSARPPSGSISSPPATRARAIALTVKSRLREVLLDRRRPGAARSRRRGRLRRSDHPPGAERLRQPEHRPADLAGQLARGRARGRPPRRCRCRSPRGPSSSSRSAPPTIQRPSVTGTCSRASHARQQAGRDLVVDRAEPPRHLLGEDPLLALRADQDHLVAHRHVRVRRRARP